MQRARPLRVTTPSQLRASASHSWDTSPVPTQWLVTRESEDAAADVAALAARGLHAVEVPCLETRYLAWPWAGPAPLTLFTSRRTVEAWVSAGRPALADVAAMSPATSGALVQQGVTPLITARGGAVALAHAILASWDGKGCAPSHLHYPVSNAGLRAPEQEEAVRLLERRTRLERRTVYEVHVPEGLAGRLAEATRGEWSAVFASPSAVAHFFSACPPTAPPRHVLCMGGSTVRAWDAARMPGWPAAIPGEDLSRTLEELAP